ncbi:LysR family transcriptional regulator [Dongia sp.]|uniref:LysR family transcriptional regulator n=1 Tax=Dongia sp. TaxID=1977262 RepID=UPI0035AE0B79
MDLRQLRYFVAIVEHGSFSKAANQLRVAQPALSQHLRHMEEELGVTLLHRGTRGVLPTEAGERLLQRAKAILTEFGELRDTVRGEKSAPVGEVCFGIPGTVSELLSVPLIEAAQARYPTVRIRIAEAMSGYILDWLRRGEVDLAMIYSTSNPGGLAIHHALTEELCLFGAAELEACQVATGNPVTLAEAANLDLILPGPAHGLRDLIEEAALSINAPIWPAIEIDSYGQIKQLVQRGRGYGILPRTAIAREVKAGTFNSWPLTAPPLTRKVFLAYSTERPLPAAVRAIGQLAWETLRQLVQDGAWAANLADESNRPSLYL